FPKFEMKAHDELDDVLKAMGIKEAFSSDADFSALSDTPLKVGLFEQASFVKVDENGTVMGTVSKGNGVLLAPEPVSFYMNRPFAFIISEQSTGSILLIGKIVNF
ncbi:MAG: serpin family protein, partial [Bacteroides sp.]|nr:serpin family protein [Bacteroides sp.]MBQ8874229.1 serpin family protein [Bacteroides sp.]